MRRLACGEALVDLLPSPEGGPPNAIPGGSPLNVAVGLARLGVPSGFFGKITSDAFGQRLLERLRGSGVDMTLARSSDRPTATARVVADRGAEPRYTFHVDGTADRFLRVEDLPDDLPPTVPAIHGGSYSMGLEPIGTAITALLECEFGEWLISVDPNVRPTLIEDSRSYRALRGLGIARNIGETQ